MDRIFDPYFSTKDKDKGTGLGLAVVHGIVKSYGGSIFVNSRIGEGTTVQVVLPVTDNTPDDQIEQRKTLPGGTEKILYIDDEKNLVDIGCQMLERLGYDATGIAGSFEALEIFKQSPQRFDLVITDLSMPGLTGDQLAQELIRIRPSLPIILCTGYSDRIDQKIARLIGFRILLMKPLAMNILAKTVRDVLDES